jgi:Cupin-like domain
LSLKTGQIPLVSCDYVFSDVLYRPYLCANTSLAPYVTGIPNRNAITRLEDLSPVEFASYWSNRPFILTKPIKEWPIYKTWDSSKLLEEYSEVKFRAEAVDWPLRTYVSYMNNNLDESPLYLFDKNFVEKMGLIVGRNQQDAHYWIPDCFGNDLFAVLGDYRPDSRWLIIGPVRSGSTFHKDPNATSAWNAVLRGSKYWIMFPTDVGSPPPPGVYVSEDQSEVTSPLSIAEWLIGFHAEARKTPGCLEGICGEGEVLHVPSGWWHLVVNLDTSIAITQNFVPRSHLSSVLSFLKNKPDQVSGFKQDVKDPYNSFVFSMEKQYPELLAQAIADLGKLAEAKKRKWESAVGEVGSEGFRFGLGRGDYSDEDIP